MILIAHRGNVEGSFSSWENEPTYIDLAIKKGFDVEIDVWLKDRILFLGHDAPIYGVDFRWFRDRATKIWIHCKNLEALSFFKDSQYNFNYFWHQEDDFTLTSHGYIWTYPGKPLTEKSIAVMPELKIHEETFSKCYGICTDFPSRYIGK